VATASTRRVTGRFLDRGATAALAAASAGWAVVLAGLLRHRVFASHDAVNNYAHVWFIARQLWHHHRLPWRMPVLGHGAAYTFPYALVAWTSAALVWPLFGDWTVTLWLALGLVGMVAAMLWALPELLPHRWLGAAALVNPALVLSVIFGQLPFLWASAFLFGAIGAWRHRRPAAAAVCAALAQSGHPAVVLPIMTGIVLGRLPWEPRPRTLLRWWAVSLLPAVPAAWLVTLSPAYHDSSSGLRWLEFVHTLEVRMLVVAVPLALVAVARQAWERAGPALFVALLGGNVVLAGPLASQTAWQALTGNRDRTIAALTHSPQFTPGATYRVLQASGNRVGMYDILRAGGRLDSEFFPESMQWVDFPGTAAYATLLTRRHIDFVIDCPDFDHRFATNEHALLNALTTGAAAADRTTVRTRLASRTPGYSLYRVLRSAGTDAAGGNPTAPPPAAAVP
jgi:hypothetical protein